MFLLSEKFPETEELSRKNLAYIYREQEHLDQAIQMLKLVLISNPKDHISAFDIS